MTEPQGSHLPYATTVIAAAMDMALHTGGASVTAQATPADLAMKQRFLDWLRGEPMACPHDPASQPVQLWQAHRPLMTCLPCYEAIVAETQGTPEDRRCDLCGIVQPPGPLSIGIRAWTIDGGGDFAPIIAHYGVCEGCLNPGPQPEIIESTPAPWTEDQFNARPGDAQ